MIKKEIQLAYIVLASANSLATKLEESLVSAMRTTQTANAVMRRQKTIPAKHEIVATVNYEYTFIQVSAVQYALCLDAQSCMTHCQQQKQNTTGVCTGPQNWDCYCENNNGSKEKGKHPMNP